MDFNDTPTEAAFRAEARQWLAAHAPAHEMPQGVRLPEEEEADRGRAWMRELFDGGWSGLTFPKALGGRGLSGIEAVIFAEEEGCYHLPKGPFTSIGTGMALPVIARHGTDEQRARFIEPTLKGDMTWCQLFSEPAAGSDLAALRTRAVRADDGSGDWIVNGQKVWSSWAHLTDWGILVVRTDPTVPKHKGLTFFVVDMKTPGIETRPIRQISGASEFNETFLTDVRIPDANRLGAPGEGWACCMTVLMGERLGSGAHRSKVEPLLDYAAATPDGVGGTMLEDAAVRRQLAEALAEEQGERHFQARLRTMVSRGEDPGALAGMVKLAYASRYQKVSGLGMELRGPAAIAADPQDSFAPDLQYDYIYSTVMRIAGGADEVLRNQIAERVLGMPGEVRMDKDVPFDQLR
ncbi:acyl-CoA dehydrogenase family protein [Novosphingobium sp. KCTC 2891]|uniref:acyl-CoA dehydrogenase family protein n=1 Tax=Novosphingobium sp. KCTC 2891 TaxID=2989730 RepID=UPI002222669B|nr:acyl-CoA dehydrogenase family protein [Novosphingobium sp. KCTC 2891]MCW1383666.1 acyl-CoA dehydrogenase family protein [Novosphingobium sp. KCTC 2891]